MTQSSVPIGVDPRFQPKRVYAFALDAKAGLNPVCAGVIGFDADPADPVGAAVAKVAAMKPGDWAKPNYGKMKTALSVGLNADMNVLLLYVLSGNRDKLDFAAMPVSAGSDGDAQWLVNAERRTSGDDDFAIVGVRLAGGPPSGSVSFNLHCEARGKLTGADGKTQDYCTPVIIDPDGDWPPTGGGMGGGGIP